jgi:hypothetical protein
MNTSFKNFAASVAAASVLAIAPVYALTPSETLALKTQVSETRVVEVSSIASQLVVKAPVKERTETAVAVVLASFETHPTALTSVIASVLKVAPEATEAVVTAAVEAAPDRTVAIVRAAAEAAPTKADKVLLVASRNASNAQVSAMTQEVAQVRARRLAATAEPVSAALVGSGVTQDAPTIVGPITVITDTYAGADPSRP